MTISPHNKDQTNTDSSEKLRTAEAVATTGVVCGVCSFTAGLLLGVYVVVTVIGRRREARLRHLLFMRTFPWKRHPH